MPQINGKNRVLKAKNAYFMVKILKNVPDLILLGTSTPDWTADCLLAVQIQEGNSIASVKLNIVAFSLQ